MLISANFSRARFTWTSPSTNIVYCGLCLRQPVKPVVGAKCFTCGALVAETLNLPASSEEIRCAWKRALSRVHDAENSNLPLHCFFASISS
jgi:hypothetical protein